MNLFLPAARAVLGSQWLRLRSAACLLLVFFLQLPGVRAQCISQGPRQGSAALNNTLIGSIGWLNIANIFGSDDNHALASALIIGDNTNYVLASGFTFSIPLTATVCGIVVEMEKGAAGLFSNVTDNSVRLLKAGALVGNNLGTAASWPGADTYFTHGGSSNLWGTTWLPIEINNAGFGVAVSANLSGAVLPTARIDNVRITVYYTTVVLPVELIRFEAVRTGERSSLVSWATATETNSDSFGVERSIDGSSWELLGQVKGAGNSHSRINYEFTDTDCPGQLCYFRLRQTDKDKSVDYSPIISLPDKTLPPSSISVSSDAFCGCLHLYCTAGIAQVSITDPEGRQLSDLPVEKGTKLLDFPATGKARGVYVLRVVDVNGNAYFKKVILGD